MKKRMWIFNLAALVLLQLALALPSIAGDYNVSDIALSPGADITQLNLNWHTNTALTSDGTNECAVEIAKKRYPFKMCFPNYFKYNLSKYREKPQIFYGTKASAGVDELGVADYYCEVDVSNLKNQTNYVYRVGDGTNWSDNYEYSTANKNKFGFIFSADTQLGASGSKDYSTSEAKTYIATDYLTNNYSTVIAAITDTILDTYFRAQYTSSLAQKYLEDNTDYTDDEITALLALYTADTLDDTDAVLDAAIDAYVTAGITTRITSFWSTDTTDTARISILATMYTDVASGSSTMYLPSTYHKAIKKLYDAYKTDTTGEMYYAQSQLTTLAGLETTYNVAGLASELIALRAARLASQKAAAASDTEGWLKTLDVIAENLPRPAFIMTSGDQVENAREYEWTGFLSPEALTSITVAPTIGSHDAGANFGYHFNLPNESTTYGVSTSGGDYYFTYGNALFIVLNMDATMNLYPRSAPPPPPSGSGGAPPAEQTCAGIVDDATFAETLYDLEHGCTTDSTTGAETCTEVDGLADFKASIAEHEAFIQEAIDANPNARWKIVNWHYSIYSAGNHSSEDVIRAMKVYMIPVIDEFDIDLGLMAHDHVYTRTFQMLNDDPQEDQVVGGKTHWIYNPTGTLFVTGATTSGSKYYSLNNCYDCDEPDDYYEYVALGDDMSRTDDNDTADDTSDDEDYKTPNFTYINVDNSSLKLSSYAYRITDEDTGDYTMELIDTYTIKKVDQKTFKLIKKWPFLF